MYVCIYIYIYIYMYPLSRPRPGAPGLGGRPPPAAGTDKRTDKKWD